MLPIYVVLIYIYISTFFFHPLSFFFFSMSFTMYTHCYGDGTVRKPYEGVAVEGRGSNSIPNK